MNYKKNLSLAIVVASFFPLMSEGATFNISNTSQLRNAINQARANGPGKDIIRINTNSNSMWMGDGGTIVINTPVEINGLNPAFCRIFNSDNSGVMFDIRSSNVTLKNMTMSGYNNQRGGTAIRFVGTIWNTVISGNVIRQTGNSITAFGDPPKNLTITNNTFNNVSYSLWLWRDLGRVASGSDGRWGGLYKITGNTVVNSEAGFLLDNGNDGTDWVNGGPVHAAQNYLGSPESPFTTNYAEGSEISNNTITNVRIFGVGLAKVGNVDINNNTISMANNGGFGSCIQLEHNSVNSTLKGNKCTSYGNKNGIYLVTFTDHGASAAFENGCYDIRLQNNVFFGNGIAVHLRGFANVKATNNDLRQNNRVGASHVPGGRNWFSQNFGNLGVANGTLPVRTYGPL